MGDSYLPLRCELTESSVSPSQMLGCGKRSIKVVCSKSLTYEDYQSEGSTCSDSPLGILSAARTEGFTVRKQSPRTIPVRRLPYVFRMTTNPRKGRGTRLLQALLQFIRKSDAEIGRCNKCQRKKRMRKRRRL